MDITTRGATLHVQTYGEGGDPVLLLHGALSDNAQNWRLIHEPLAKKHRLIGLDLRGHGKSDNPSGIFTLEALRDDVVDVLDALDLDRVHVLGASLGGYVGMALRHAHPARVGTLATAGSKIGWDHATAADRADFFQPHNILAAHPLWAPHLAKAHGGHYGPEHWKTLVRNVRELLQTLPDEPAVQYEALADASLPLFYAVGDRDDLVPLAEVVHIRTWRPDAAILVAPQAGHLFRDYNQDLFVAGYKDFLRRNPLNR
ncbi:MAG: h16 [Cyanobacteria bacterium RYN_339]|nr:h16 [Cyanobacteria bacterium RYN_339]